MKRKMAALLLAWMIVVSPAIAYVLNYTIADSTDPRNAGISGCPQPDHMDTTTPSKLVNRRWSTFASSAVVTSTGAWAAGNSGQTTEIGQVVADSFAVWTGVSGTTLTPARLGALQTTTTQNACSSSDGLNTICFNQSAGFSSGVLAFTVTITSDILGEKPFSGSGPSAFIGELLDADILFNPSGFTFATPAALATNPSAYDLESVLAHELGHVFGLSHSSVWRSLMWPFAPLRGTFAGQADATSSRQLLSDDDRVGLRVLYPDPADTTNVGTISGKVLPANPISLATLPAPSPGRGVTGIFGAQVVAVDTSTGAVVASVLAGWSCDAGNLPTLFDGSYKFEKLPVGRSYLLVAEPLDGPTDSTNLSLSDLCRAGTTNACSVPSVNTLFSTRIRPAP